MISKAEELGANGIEIDINAQKIHKLGVGIIVNDVPHIPFIEKFTLIN